MGLLVRPLIALASYLDQTRGWENLRRSLGLVTVLGIRSRLRRENLEDTLIVKDSPPRPPDVNVRTLDGGWNDLGSPSMGSVGTRFGRNVPLDRTHPEPEPSLLDPDPRRVSRELLTRRKFLPATSLNVLAAAWLQFEVHDWFSHEPDEHAPPFELELAADDPWPGKTMSIRRTKRDTEGNGAPPTYATYDSHWWDGSQIYGKDADFTARVRADGGKLRIDDDGLPPADLVRPDELEGVAGNFWLGLGLLHTLFMLEHNAICDALREAYPSLGDETLYQKARLVNAALMAKIHTVEWTPAVIAHPTTVRGMNANWYGLVGPRFGKHVPKFLKNEVLTGIPGSRTKHHAAPYSLTEEFVAVYRMHPLIPDDYVFLAAETGRELARLEFPDLGALQTRTRLEELGMANALYSFGVAHPGAIRLHNYPKFLQELHRPVGPPVDLAATDILRIRERGVPRYREFRELLHRRPVASFEELTGDEETAAELRDVYGDLDRLDLMIGLYAEPLPQGFGFSDTAFRVFVLMASRRLKSDRFFTNDYTREVYTDVGLEWIDGTTMVRVILRHYPELEPVLRACENAFQPWPRAPR